MYYLIDGYNFIFSLIESKETLHTLRQKVVRTLQKQFARRNLSGMIVFDGSHKRDEESGLSYPSPLIVAYAPKGQSADEYIVEWIERAVHPKQVVVVTNDRGLGRHVKAAGAKVESNHEFIAWLNKRKRKEAAEPRETEANINRLLKIFEDKLREES